jgi:3-carboxy-cis,cis-muconate cycloisomerase
MYMQLNATVIDSSIYHDIFSITAMRAVWSDQAPVQRYLDVEKALSLVEGRLGVIPSEAAEFHPLLIRMSGDPRHTEPAAL